MDATCESPRLRHGHARKGSVTATYVSWVAMWKRCTYAKHPAFNQYGGRGIAVCDRWADFDAFLSDMGERPAGKTLDRFPNRDGNYEPGNCRWATNEEQARNRGSNRRMTVLGVTRTLAEWADLSGIGFTTLRQRLDSGWAPERVVGEAVRTGRVITLHGETLTLREWADRLGIRKGLIQQRLQRGWTAERALSPARGAR